MTPDRFRECLDAIGWTGRELGRQLSVDERQVRRWAGSAGIPDRIAEWIERLAQFHEANPSPRRTSAPTIEWDSEFPAPPDRRVEIEGVVQRRWIVRELGASPAIFEVDIDLEPEGRVTAYGDNRGLVLTCEYHLNLTKQSS